MPSQRDSRGRFLTDEATKCLNHDIFGRDVAESAWLAGLVAADGNISSDRKRLSLNQSGDAGRLLIEKVRRMTAHTGAVSVRQPLIGNVTYGISMASTEMIDDLLKKYGVTPRKTLTYAWPKLDACRIPPFLRGYVDGDGCVSVYPTPQGNPMLHLSFVGTPPFIDGAMAAVPAYGRRRIIKRCKNLVEARYNGRHAWAAATWLYADETLFSSAKHQAFVRYQELLRAYPPKWHTWSIERQQVLMLLSVGKTPGQVAAETGLPISRIYSFRDRARRAATE